MSVRCLEGGHSIQELMKTGGNRNEAAKLLGIGRATLFRLLKKIQADQAKKDAG